MADQVRRAVLWQPMGDWRIGHVETVEDFCARVASGEYRSGALRVTIEPTSYQREEMAAEHAALCDAVYDCGALTFFQEEISLVASAQEYSGELAMLAVKGRHRAVSMVTIGQRFAQFPVIVRGTSSRVLCFRQTDPIDVKGIYERFSPYEPPIDPAQLPDRQYLEWTPLGGVALRKSR